MATQFYNANPNLKSAGVVIEYTAHTLSEYAKCKEDPIYFIKNYIKIISLDRGIINFELYDYQVKFIRALHENRRVIGLLPRQMGKTTTVAAYLVWYLIFNEAKSVAILANKAAAAREIMSRMQLMVESLPKWLQQGVVEWNKGSIEFENKSKAFTAATSSSGIRGKSVNFLYVDEAAIIPNTVADEFFTSTYPTISAGITTKIALTSTPLGLNHFWKFWTEAESGSNGFTPVRVEYWEHPERDEKWAEAQRQLLGDLKYRQEVLMDFLGSAATLINPDAIQRMAVMKPIYEKDGMRVFFPVEKGSPNPDKPGEWLKKPGSYAIICDTASGVGGDSSAFSVIRVDVTPYVVVARFKDNKISPLLYPNIIHKWAVEYNEAWVLIELNKSEQVPYILQAELEYENLIYVSRTTKGQVLTGGFGGGKTQLGILTDKKVKRIGCTMLKTLVEEGKLHIHDSDTISEISTFIEHKGSYAADDGYHDDIVMTLVLFGWLTSQAYFKELTDIDLRKDIYEARIRMIEDEVLPIGFFFDGTQAPAEEVWVDYVP